MNDIPVIRCYKCHRFDHNAIAESYLETANDIVKTKEKFCNSYLAAIPTQKKELKKQELSEDKKAAILLYVNEKVYDTNYPVFINLKNRLAYRYHG